MKNQYDKVELFLNKMKEVFSEEIQFVFYRGFCYWLAFILADRFNGEIWFNPKIVHFACRIDGQLYDIFGKVDAGISPFTGEPDGSENTWISWEQFQIQEHDAAESVINSCIKKEGV